MTVHLSKRDAHFLRFRAIFVADEVRALVVLQNEIGDAVFTQGLMLDHAWMLFVDDSRSSQIRSRKAGSVATPASCIIRATWL